MLWMSYSHRYEGARFGSDVGFGAINDDGTMLQPYKGFMYRDPEPEGEPIKLAECSVLLPTSPSKLIALWNNYKALADEKGLSYPKTPLYVIKPSNTYLSSGSTIKHPPSYTGDVFYEGELGIVINELANKLSSPEEAAEYIFGYTAINDVTAFGLLKEDANFDQWTRAKGFDTFGVIGPAIATDLNYADLEIITRVDGKKVQHYPASDMLMSPAELIYYLSQNMSLSVGDVICCGTSVGLGPMPRGCTVEVEIPGIGILSNLYK